MKSTSKPYYLLVVLETIRPAGIYGAISFKRWEYGFGDYSKEVVEEELQDWKDSGESYGAKRKMKVVRSIGDTQDDIEKTIKALNEGLVG